MGLGVRGRDPGDRDRRRLRLRGRLRLGLRLRSALGHQRDAAAVGDCLAGLCGAVDLWGRAEGFKVRA